jgi:hypothetical protein
MHETKGLLVTPFRSSAARLACLVAGALAVLLSGCFDIRQAVKLNADRSGTASVSIGIDLEPMALAMLQIQRSMEGKTGDPTAEEIAKAKQDFIANSKTTVATHDDAERRAEVERRLPPGVKLVAADMEDHGLKQTIRLTLSFDDINKLSQVELPGDSKQPQAPNPMSRPFGNLEVKDEGKFLVLTSKLNDPTAALPGGGGAPGAGGPANGSGKGAKGGPDAAPAVPPTASPEVQKLVDDAFKNFRYRFEIETPFEVVQSNATRHEGKTLVWEFSYEQLKSQPQKAPPTVLQARFRK